MGGIISGGKGPAVPSLLQNREAGGVKANTGLAKIIASLNKVREEVKALRKAISFLTRSLQTPSGIMAGLPRPAYTSAEEKEERRRRKEERRERRREKKRKREWREKRGRY